MESQRGPKAQMDHHGLLQCMSLKMMWWTVPAPGNEVP
jgi:hypothetical protein